MIRCTFHLNGGTLSTLSCPGVGFFPAYSGYVGSIRNNPDDMAVVKRGPLPIGKYYIVSRPTGGFASGLHDYMASLISGSDRSVWFALYRVDDNLDDHTFIGKVERGNFRLHPAGYKGISEGCITFPNLSDFIILRDTLLATATFPVSASLRAYGTIQVY